jgi:hypothetical protein
MSKDEWWEMYDKHKSEWDGFGNHKQIPLSVSLSEKQMLCYGGYPARVQLVVGDKITQDVVLGRTSTLPFILYVLEKHTDEEIVFSYGNRMKWKCTNPKKEDLLPIFEYYGKLFTYDAEPEKERIGNNDYVFNYF